MLCQKIYLLVLLMKSELKSMTRKIAPKKKKPRIKRNVPVIRNSTGQVLAASCFKNDIGQ